MTMWCNIQTTRSCNYLMKVNCVTEQHYNELLWRSRDALVYKFCSPHVRKHVCLVQIKTNVPSS